MSYPQALDAMKGSGSVAAPPNPTTLGVGDPPGNMPGLPPASKNIGAIPTGNTGTNKKLAADNLIQAIRDAQGHFPNLKDQLNSLIDQIKISASAPKAPLTSPTPPSPQDAASGAMDTALKSGSPGNF